VSSQRLPRAVAASRTLMLVALAALQAGLCAACIGTVPVAEPPRAPAAEPPARLVGTEREEQRALEPDHWGDD